MNTNYTYENKDETDFCLICGSESVYYVFENDEDDIGKYYCANCESEYMFTGTEYRDTGELVILYRR